MAASTMMDASYDRKRYVKPCACLAKLLQSQPPRARGTAAPARRLSLAPPPRRRALIPKACAARGPRRDSRETRDARESFAAGSTHPRRPDGLASTPPPPTLTRAQAHLDDASMDNSYSHLAKHMSQGDVLQSKQHNGSLRRRFSCASSYPRRDARSVRKIMSF